MTRGLLVSAPRSGSGKTIVTLGLQRAFARRGRKVVGAKNGPDYIDPAFHAAATRHPSLNLDTWAMAPDMVRALAAGATADADLLVCEGSMGLFDGVAAPPRRSGASADLAALLGLPVLLVLDVSGQAQTAAALAHGCASFDPDVRIGGVVLNRVASPRHRALVAEALAARGFTLVGALGRNETLALPERHLGLVQAGEHAALDAQLDAIADVIEMALDLEAIEALAAPLDRIDAAPALPVPPPGQRIAVARDAAFSFLYPHLLQGWRRAGAEILVFSPLADEAPPRDADCCWLPGGYPELHAGPLAAAARFKAGLRTFASSRPVHGECGGYMVLGQSLTDAGGTAHEMVALLPPAFSFARRKMSLGYRAGQLAADCLLGPAGTRLRGHEFHYATVEGEPDEGAFATVRDLQDGEPVKAGSRFGRVTGSFFHLVALDT